MGDVKVDVEYLSIGANRQTAAGDWNVDGTVAFGADTNVALWKPNDSIPKGIFRLLSGHKDLVKAVKFLPPVSSSTAGDGDEHRVAHLLSGGDDKSIKLWRLDTQTGSAACIQTVLEHTAPVNCIAALSSSSSSIGSQQGEGSTIFATGAADATVRIWHFDGDAIKVLQTIKTSTPRYFPLAVTLSPLGSDGSTFILASAGTRDIVQIYTGSLTRPSSSSSANTTPTTNFALSATLTGHEGWIRSLDFTPEVPSDPSGDLLLASASQDKYIRLWRVHAGSELPAQAATASDPTVGAYLPGRSPSNKAHRFRAGTEAEQDYSITFESLLFNHDDWIYSARWHTGSGGASTSSSSGQPQLLSTSADNSLAVWEADPSTGIWVTTARLGEISREKGATTATGSIGGFWTGLWSPSGASILTLGRTGSWRRWDWDPSSSSGPAWVQNISVSGHVRPVTGIAWSRTGSGDDGNGNTRNNTYLLSTSADQTTRLHARWQEQGTWHEMARPQIHGYDLNCIDALSGTRFVSGADEKLMRVFDQPRAVARLLHGVAGIGSAPDASMPDAANMPVLGLSNKATVDEEDAAAAAATAAAAAADASSTGATTVVINDPETANGVAVMAAPHRPPLEEALSRHTLWPEVEKLYGHGYEISCLAASHDGRLVASACRASSLNHAVIRLFETDRWTELRPPLAAHSLTVTRLRFSGDDRYLLSVGRDRQWAVFEERRKEGGGGGGGEGEVGCYELLQAEPKGHTRMILDAAWAPAVVVGGIFATAGRDKNVKVWVMRSGEEDGKFRLAATIVCDQPVTAVDFLDRPDAEGRLVLASGSEAGKISIHVLQVDSDDNGGGKVTVVSTSTLQPE
ncbi:WD40 repeat-like protein [Cryphonectria parasitica EP155]|uniref:Elongator complex protein 2 n=1 Tax=Cryphonectria parasitica (strain ATCC 38755 / EP155) TaxID=660469 RepID=A0A9P4YEJ5_CRYP1|nr:WD40 repeat-like protein [Cryphonectria parasitica EP155]KAF3771252.1 WD40 repeat-like protein [Cryphonectria parasitica EP155]